MDAWRAKEVSDCFVSFSEGKEYLSKEDLKVAMTALFGFRPTKYEIGRIIELAGTLTHSGKVERNFLYQVHGGKNERLRRGRYHSSDVRSF